MLRWVEYGVYFPIGDICTIVVCMIYTVLLHSTYTVRHQNLSIFRMTNSLTAIAAVFSIFFHMMKGTNPLKYSTFIYGFRCCMHLCLMLTFAMFCIYLCNLVRLSGEERKRVDRNIAIAYVIFLVAEIVSPFTRMGFYIDSVGKMRQNWLDPFLYVYLYYAAVAVYILRKHRERMITRVRQCLQMVMAMSLLVMIIQIIFKQDSYTCITFTYPILAALFLFHYNAYDSETGTLDAKSFDNYIDDIKKNDFSMISMHLGEINREKMQQMQEYFFHFNEKFFRDTCTFRMTVNQMTMIYSNSKNPNREEKIQRLLKDFYELYDEFQVDYKLVFVSASEQLSSGEEYLELIRQTEEKMEWNQYYMCEEKDIKSFLRNYMITKALKDIHMAGNLEDDRVKVFCQPVFNTQEGKFTTAEALMRIVLPDAGMIFPDEFIPIAEQNDYIHTLSKIILHKTCKEIIRLEQKGYFIERVSVNFSMVELRDRDFCEDVITIISMTGVEPGKIAIELTESRNESDYENVKSIMGRLHGRGIKFYLDDFGTGYSNFARIIGLPIDIIKFDRSLTIMSGKDEESRYLVGSFSDIFDNSQYQILFEGVEDENDENRCKEMKALYLQGYKYSKPIPIEQLENFLEKRAG